MHDTVTVIDQALLPIALSHNTSTVLHQLRELLMAEMFDGRFGEELALDSAKQDVLVMGIGTTMALLIDDGACWGDLMGAIEQTIQFRDHQDLDEIQFAAEELGIVFHGYLPDEVAKLLF